MNTQKFTDFINNSLQDNAPAFVAAIKSGRTVKSVLSGGGGFNNPFSFYLDAAAPNGGDGTQGKPFNTIQSAITVIENLTQNAYTLFVAPGDYTGADVDISGIQGLNIIGLGSNANINFEMNFTLTGGAHNYFNTSQNCSFNGVWFIDMSLSTFSILTFQDCYVPTIQQADSNPSSQILIEKTGFGGGIFNGKVYVFNSFIVGNANVQGTGFLTYEDCVLLGNPVVNLSSNAHFKSIGISNPMTNYVNGTDNTSQWLTDAASNAPYNGTLTRTIYGQSTGAQLLCQQQIDMNVAPQNTPNLMFNSAVGNFNGGESIDNGAGVTADIVSADNINGKLILTNVIGGVFNNGDIITANGAGATAKVLSYSPTMATDISVNLTGGSDFIITDVVLTQCTAPSSAQDFQLWNGTGRSGVQICSSNNGGSDFLQELQTTQRFISMSNDKLLFNGNETRIGNGLFASVGTPQGSPMTCYILIYGYILN